MPCDATLRRVAASLVSSCLVSANRTAAYTDSLLRDSTSNDFHASSSIEAGFRSPGSEPFVNINANVEAKYAHVPSPVPPPNVATPFLTAPLPAARRIKNPLIGIPRRTLLAQVDEFCRVKGLDDHRPLIRKGALVAQDPTGYEDITGDEALTDQEIESLRDEVLHKWRIPRVLYLTIITCSIGAAVQGWDQTGSNGANLAFPKAYNIDGTTIHDKLIVGLVNAAPYIGTAFFGCWLSDPINNYFGRRGTIFVAANFCLWPVIASAFCDTWVQLLGCRLLLGVGMGTKASTGEFHSCALPLFPPGSH